MRDFGIRAGVALSYRHWTRRSHDYGDAMERFKQGQQRKNWEICPVKAAPQLFKGEIWKCAPLTYLRLQDVKYTLSESWRPYPQYQPLTPEYSDLQLAEFFRCENESFCSMCPAEPDTFKLPVPVKIRVV